MFIHFFYLDVQIKGEDDITPLHFIAKYKKKRHTDGAEEDVSLCYVFKRSCCFG